MTTLNAAALLAAWEQGISQPPVRRALVLLAAAYPDKSWKEWAETPIGERDRRLLGLRQQLFGARIEALATCPNCAERLELNFETNDVCTPAPLNGSDLQVECDGYEVRCRVPTSADLLEVSGADARQGRQTLLERCVMTAQHGDEIVEPALLPEPVVEAMMTEMANADPQADVQVALDCPECKHHWLMDFDILSYLWSELSDWAPRLLREVHLLASNYGWSERDILSMSGFRRRQYLEMIAGGIQ